MYKSEIIRMRLTYASPEFIEAYRDTPHFALKEALERVAA